MYTQTNLSEKVIINAKSSYFMFFINLTFFLSEDPNINHPFVKSHIKSAFPLHFLFLLTYLIFISFGFLGWVSIFGIFLNHILAALLFLGLFAMLLYGFSKAHKGEYFEITDMIHFTSKEKILHFNHDNHIDEKDKLSVVLSLIPFSSPFIQSKQKDIFLVENNSKLTLYITIFGLLLYIGGVYNILILFFLLYIIFIVFSGLLVFSTAEMYIVNVSKIWSFREVYVRIKILFGYLSLYLKGKFTTFDTYKNEYIKKEKEQNELNQKILEGLGKYTWKLGFIYIPLVNFVTIKKLSSEMMNHIKNGIGISILYILSLFLILLFDFSWTWLFFPLLPIIYGFAYSSDKTYKLPFLYDLGQIFLRVLSFGKRKAEMVQELRKKETEVQFVVKN